MFILDYIVILLIVILSLISFKEALPARGGNVTKIGGMNLPPPRGGLTRTRRERKASSKRELYRMYSMTY